MGESRRCIQPEVDVLSTLVGSQTRLCDRRTAPRGIVHVWNMCPLPVFYIYRGGSGICVRHTATPWLARWRLAAPLGPDEFGLHECDTPLCVKVCGADAPRRHVVIGDQGDNMRRMARMRRGGGRKVILGDGLRTRRERSVALRAVLRERGWYREAVE